MFVPSVRGREGEGVDGRLSVGGVRLSEFLGDVVGKRGEWWKMEEENGGVTKSRVWAERWTKKEVRGTYRAK